MNDKINIAISGPPGVGKSKLGRALKEDFPERIIIDTDELIVERYTSGKTVAQFVEENSWPSFRELENRCLEDIFDEHENNNLILLLGGGLLAPQSPALSKTDLELSINFRDLSLDLLRSNSGILTILPYESDLVATEDVLVGFERKKIKDGKKRKDSRPLQIGNISIGKDDPRIYDVREKIRARFGDYHKTSDYIFSCGNLQPHKMGNYENVVNIINLMNGNKYLLERIYSKKLVTTH